MELEGKEIDGVNGGDKIFSGMLGDVFIVANLELISDVLKKILFCDNNMAAELIIFDVDKNTLSFDWLGRKVLLPALELVKVCKSVMLPLTVDVFELKDIVLIWEIRNDLLA